MFDNFRYGIVIIDECPGVNLHVFDQPLLDNHLTVMDELIARDKNHPSVVMWSIGNEPSSSATEARDYFQTVADHTRQLDPTRPITLVVNQDPATDQGRINYCMDFLKSYVNHIDINVLYSTNYYINN